MGGRSRRDVMNAVRERLWVIGAAVVVAAGAAGCAKSQPAVEPELPPLEAPPPPPRLLPPLVGGPIETPAVTPPPPDAGRPPAPARRRTEASRPPDGAASRQEPRPADLPKTEPPTDAPHPSEEGSATEQAPILQLVPSAESNATEQAIRHLLTRATQDLGRVDYGALSPDAKVQYDTAKRFMVLADQAIKDRNFIFARTLADKAAVIAGVLVR
jgi:hypothetical protein